MLETVVVLGVPIAIFIAIWALSKGLDLKNDAPIGFLDQMKHLKRKVSPLTFWTIAAFFAIVFFGNIGVRIYNMKGN